MNDTDLSITAVAVLIKKPYQTARNMMLRGEFGERSYDTRRRCITVKRSAVVAWCANRTSIYPDARRTEAHDKK